MGLSFDNSAHDCPNKVLVYNGDKMNTVYK